MSKIKELELPKDDRGFYLDVNGHPVHLDNNPVLLKPNTKLPLTENHVIEIIKCSQDIHYFIQNYVQIFTLDNGWVIPELRDYQVDIINLYCENRFVNVMSGRQSGKSATTNLYILWKIIFFPDTIVGMAANKLAMSKENLGRLKEYYENLPIWLKVGVKAWNATYISLENGSKVYTAASSKSAFRGLGISICWTDEVAFLAKNVYDEFASSVIPTVSSGTKSQIFNTSTPKGKNQWFFMWEEAELGKSAYVNYRVEWWEVPGRDEIWKNNMIKTLRGGETEFNQEYACEFLGSSDTLISTSAMKRQELIDPIRTDNFIYGFNEFEEKTEEGKYIIGVDPSKDGKDGFAIQVIDISNFPFKQVASANLQVNYLKMPPILVEIAEYYNHAFVVIENNEGAGSSIVDKLYDVFEYDHLYKDKKKKYYGFRTTMKSRQQILSHLKVFVESGKLLLSCKQTLDQLQTFVNKNGKYQADTGMYDDLVMSLALTFAPFLDTNSFSDYKIFISALEYNDTKEEDEDFAKILQIGFFDTGTEEKPSENWSYDMPYTYQEFDSDPF